MPSSQSQIESKILFLVNVPVVIPVVVLISPCVPSSDQYRLLFHMHLDLLLGVLVQPLKLVDRLQPDPRLRNEFELEMDLEPQCRPSLLPSSGSTRGRIREVR